MHIFTIILPTIAFATYHIIAIKHFKRFVNLYTVSPSDITLKT